jgi:YidC/Oxa1 family membrane protein insertase
MFTYLYHLFFYDPLYNGLVFFIDILPYRDVGLAVLALTICVKLILFPLSQKALETQAKLKVVQKEIEEIKKLHKDNQQAMAQATLDVYRKHKINPFAGFFTLLIQIPLVFALYFIFSRGGLPMINMDILYSFIPVPENPNMEFLGLINMAEKSVLLAVLVGITQFFQAKLSFGALAPAPVGEASFKDDFMRGMQLQMKYILPIIMTVISLTLVSVVPLYWIVGNLFMIGQEIYFRRKGIKS